MRKFSFSWPSCTVKGVSSIVGEAVGVFATRVSNERMFRMNVTRAFSLRREKDEDRQKEK